MRFTDLKNLLTSAALITAMMVQPAIAAEIDNITSLDYNMSRVVNSNKTSGSSFSNNTEITGGVYVLLQFTPEEIDLDGIYSAELKFDISDTENAYTMYLDQIPSDWNAKTATKYSTTYGDAEWAAGVSEKVASAESNNGQVSFNIKDNLKEQLQSADSVYYAVYTKDESASFKITTSSVKLEIGANPAHSNFNNATEENIEEIILKYMTSEKLEEYKGLEDKSFVNAKMLEKKDYASMEEVEAAFEAAITAYHIDLINNADENNIEQLLTKYLSSDALEEYNQVSDKSEINAEMVSGNFETIEEIENALKAAIDEYYESHAYLFEEGYFAEFPVYDYAKADINQKKASVDYSTVGAYKNSTRTMFKFDLRDIDLDTARSIKISYDTLPSFSNWYMYDAGASYATNLIKMHNDWQGEGITYSTTFFEDTTIVGTAYKTDKGTYGTLVADVTEDVKTRGKDAEFISYYLMGVESWPTGFNSTCCYVINKECNIKMLVEYQNDAEGSYTSNISDGDEEVAVDTDIVINFEKALNTETVTKDNLVMTENGEVMSDYTIFADDKMLTVDFPKGLQYGTDYKLQIKSNLTYSGDSLHYYFPPISFKTDVEAFENDGLTVLNADGEEISSINGVTGEVTAKTRLKNNKLSETQNMIISLVLIEETEYGDWMKDIKVVPASLLIGDEISVEKTFTLGDGKYRIECMVWDSFTSRITKSAAVVE